jgi:proline dehydrogenase
LEPQTLATTELTFSDTSIAFGDKSTGDIKRARLMFSAFNQKWLLKIGPPLANFCLNVGIPVKGLIKNTVFAQVCGGESIEDCAETITRLEKAGIGTILDYSVEGQEKEQVFDATMAEIIRTIERAADNSKSFPFAVFKVTGIARFALLEAASQGEHLLIGANLTEFQKVKSRFNCIIARAVELNVRILIDAEETWIQGCIDQLTEAAMERYNTGQCLVFNTLQMYRHDRLTYLEQQIKHSGEKGYKIGFKLVRGAYMEKERLRAEKMHYPSPIQPDKLACDSDFNTALNLCLNHIDRVNICAGTHNERSSMFLTELMKEKGIEPSDKRIYFAQLLGMSDHISYNLAHAGYNVAKYVPYGPIKEVLPYLSRRAEENSSVTGQLGRELTLIQTELKRRNQK